MGSLTGQPILPAPPEAISTKGLVLRRPRISDADDIFDNYASDPEVTRFVVWRPYKDRSEVARFLQSRLARWDYRVCAVCDVENKPSARALEKVGMQREGTLRRYIVHPNVSPEPRDCFVYSRVR